MKETTTTQALAQITHALRFEDIPPEVISKSKELIVDAVACMLGGLGRVQGETVIRLFSGMGGKPQAHVYGTLKRLPLLNAVYVNAYLCSVLDFDDTYDGHPGATVIPVALSLAEAHAMTGRAFLEAVIAGYEIGIRVSNGIKPTPQRTARVRGINTWQIFCAAAVACRVLGLSRGESACAYGHAAIHAPVPTLRKWGFREGRIQWLKNNFGWTAYGGVLSALLAQNGFVADTTIFDGPDGFWIMASSDRCDYDALREPLGPYHILEVHTKPYPACRHIHPTLDAASTLKSRHRFDLNTVQRIDVETFYEVVDNYAFLPTVPFDVSFSAPFLVALVLKGLPAGTAWFQDTLLSDPQLLETARKVHITEWKEASRAYPRVKRELMARVRITLEDGRQLEAETRIPKGDPRRPIPRDELQAKWRDLIVPVLGEGRWERLMETMENVERLDRLDRLTALLIP